MDASKPDRDRRDHSIAVRSQAPIADRAMKDGSDAISATGDLERNVNIASGSVVGKFSITVAASASVIASTPDR